MSRDQLPANPLQALIAGVARATPAETGEVARHRRRVEATGPTVVLLDCSASMAERAGHRTKIAVLQAALLDLAGELAGARLVAFNSTARVIRDARGLDWPGGGTALHLALDLAATLGPSRTVVLTDGHPDDARAALAAGDRLPGRIDGIFCGPDSDAEGLAFLQRLCRAGSGSAVRCDLVRPGAAVALAGEARRLLALESRP